MKTFKTVLVCIAATSVVSFAQGLIWKFCDDKDDSCNMVESGGAWFQYDDANESGDDGIGGCTTNDFPTSPDISQDNISGPWVDLGGEITFEYNYKSSCTYKYPFAGIGFNWKDPRAPSPDIINGCDGVKIFYRATTTADVGALWLEFATCNVNDCENEGLPPPTGYNEFYAVLDFGDFLNDGKEFYFGTLAGTGDFKQDGNWGTVITDWNTVVNAAVGLKFKWSKLGEGSAAPTENFAAKLLIKRIEGIGNCEGDLSPIRNIVNRPSSFQMSLVGKNLMFSGLASDATLELRNLKGVLISRGTVGPAKNVFDVSRLNSGVYIVKIQGETRKFVLK